MSEQTENQGEQTGSTEGNEREEGESKGGDAALRSALQKERDARKDAERTLKDAQKRLNDLEGKDKTAVERLTKERDDALKDLEDRAAKYRNVLAEQAVRDAAAEAGARNVKAVYRYIKDDLDVDDDGTVTNLDKVIKDAKKEAPELFGAGAGKADGGRGGGGEAPTSMNDLIRRRAGVIR